MGQDASQVVVVTTPSLPGFRVVRTVGFAWGLVVRSRGLGGNIKAGLRSIVGGEITEFTQMLESARSHAVERLRVHAAELGANAVISARFDSSEIGQTMSEVLAYGTAVVVEPGEAPSPAD